MSDNKIILNTTETYITESGNDAYRVVEGTVLIYIVPWEKDRAGERVLLREVHSSDKKRMFPGFAFRDSHYREWRSLIVPKGEQAILELFPGNATNILKETFLYAAGIKEYKKEGYEDTLVQFYEKKLIKDQAFIMKKSSDEQKAQAKTQQEIYSAFSDDVQGGISGNGYSAAAAYACKKLGMPYPDAGVIRARCGKNPRIEDLAKAAHFLCRKVVLDADWYRQDSGVIISQNEEGEVIVCAPSGWQGYQIYNTVTQTVSKLTAQQAETVNPEAYSIGRTLPKRGLSWKDVRAFCLKSISARDLIPEMVMILVCTLIGVLLPTINQKIYDEYIPVGNIGILTQICLVMLTFMLGNICFSISRNLFGFRITSRIGHDLQNAVYDRLFSLPESFFREYDSADLGMRASSIGGIAASFSSTILLTSMSSMFAIVYLIRMGSYSAKLTWVGLAMYAGYIVIASGLFALAGRGQKRAEAQESIFNSRLFQYINAVDKIRMAGAEDKAILSCMRPYSQCQKEKIKINRITAAGETLTCVVSSIFSMVLYFVIVKDKSEISAGTFIAFNTAFGAFTSTIDSLVRELTGMMLQKPALDRIRPVFEAAPEDDDDREILSELSGNIALSNVSFAYDQSGKNILENLNFRIHSGEYVGIVGPSGCGKSTLLKLLMGFEIPQSGNVLVDDKDLQTLNKSEYRRKLGVVLQNGRLIDGSIYDNITITCPGASMKRVNEVIDQVGLSEDIAAMPMGVHTVIGENCNTISGGQMQRILIARAIIGQPKILIFDEATSALDNITQAAVTENLDRMKITRIVVAHRLSTIRHCDRILVLKDGNFIEEGNYDTLMKKQGLFYQLAKRQITE